ncbi:MAG: major capsid protein [Microviridae sp.]|nr:MAG: major capsid protein [Microviridae sp.]
MKRQKHSLSHYRLATMDMGKLYPVDCVEVLMGDSFNAHSSALIRVSPLVAPVMHPVSVRLHHWFVPSRILWDGWEDFITGGPDGAGGSAGAYPVITAPVGGFPEKGLADYLGIPPLVPSLEVCALPFRAYNLIYNEFYRDQDLVTEAGEDDQVIRSIAWEKDYFTDARPWAQKGPQVSLPLGVSAPVSVNEVWAGATQRGTLGHTSAAFAGKSVLETTPLFAGTEAIQLKGVADLSAATAANVTALREAMALQRYEEARAQWGSRFAEYLRYYGIRSSDARLQRPEYLGGGKQTITFSEVLRTGAESAADPVGIGDMYGHGIAAVRTRPYLRFFEEHGYVVTLMSVRPMSIYMNGLHRMWSRRIKEDYFTRELEAIGQQEVLDKEVFATTADTVFGYQNRYREYCEHPSQVSSEFRTVLDFWHLARNFASAPALNASFVECDPSKRIHQVESNDVLWCMINHNIRARRMVSRNPIARIL